MKRENGTSLYLLSRRRRLDAFCKYTHTHTYFALSTICTFARRSEKIGARRPRSRRKWSGNRRRKRKLSIDPPFESVDSRFPLLFIPATNLSLSLCSFNSRYMHRGRGIRAMMPEGMRGAHKRHLYPLQLAEL